MAESFQQRSQVSKYLLLFLFLFTRNNNYADEGEVYTWGDYGEFGQLGLGPSKGTKATEGPTQITSLKGKAVDIACGDNHCLCVVANDSEQKWLYSWGRNVEGQLGLGDTNHRWVSFFFIFIIF